MNGDFERILVTGGAGYVGSLLIPQLLADGHQVTVYDTMWYGSDFFPANDPRLRLVTGDIRDTSRFADAVAGNSDYPIGMPHMVNVVAAFEAIVQSIETGAPVSLN